MKLTKQRVDSAKYPTAGQVFLRDEELRGFALRITTGSKTFVLEREINGRVRRMTLGRYGPLTVDQAREIARVKIGEIAKGQDPAGERQARQHSPTFAELAQLYLERHAVHKKSASNDITLLDKHLAGWRSRRLSAITRADVSTRHAEMGASDTGRGSERRRLFDGPLCLQSLR